MMNRANVLRGLAVIGAGAAFSGPAAAANARRFDVHHHYVSPEWMVALGAESRVHHFPGLEIFGGWSAAAAIEAMDAAGVGTSVLSTTTPGIWFGDAAQTRRLARNMNEFGAKLVADHKGRYGLFAVLPLPDVPSSLTEVAYALDTLKADGISVLTSYGTKWLGDASFEPLWQELDRRHAVVFAHATAPDCCRGLLVPHIEATVVEFNTDVARTIISLIESGAAGRYPNIRFVFSHGGGTIADLAGGYFRVQADTKTLASTVDPSTKLGHLRRFYYDTAGSANPVQMQALKMVVPATQILFGTDYPWEKPVNIATGLAGCGFTDAELAGINLENGLRLLPQFR